MMYSRGAGALAGCFGYGENFSHYGFGMPMMFVGLLITGVIIFAIVHMLKKNGHKGINSNELELLNTHFVKGEITEEEYSRMKTVLKSK